VRVLVAGIGYRNLSDHSVGVAVVEALAGREWPCEVSVEDLSYGPIAVVQRLEDDPPERRFGRAVVVSAIPREGRAPGTVAAYRWDGVLPPPEGVQRAVCDAVTGVILLDNTLIVARHFGLLPDEVAVVEVEPVVHAFGESFSPPIAAAFGPLCERVARLAGDPSAAAALPLAPLGEGRAVRLEVA
jgi:hydrogenase maturation protease